MTLWDSRRSVAPHRHGDRSVFHRWDATGVDLVRVVR